MAGRCCTDSAATEVQRSGRCPCGAAGRAARLRGVERCSVVSVDLCVGLPTQWGCLANGVPTFDELVI